MWGLFPQDLNIRRPTLPGLDFSGFGDRTVLFPLILGQMLLTPRGNTGRSDKKMNRKRQSLENPIAQKYTGLALSIVGLSETF